MRFMRGPSYTGGETCGYDEEGPEGVEKGLRSGIMKEWSGRGELPLHPVVQHRSLLRVVDVVDRFQ